MSKHRIMLFLKAPDTKQTIQNWGLYIPIYTFKLSEQVHDGDQVMKRLWILDNGDDYRTL